MPSTVYCITHRSTGRQYIGMTARPLSDRWREHRRGRGDTYIARAFRKYGEASFDVCVIAQLPTRYEALIAERIAIAIYRPEMNMTAGGDGCAQYKRVHSAETRAKIAATLTGRKLPEEVKAKLRGRPAPNRGKPMTEQARAALSAAKMGRVESADAKAARIAGLRAHYSTPEARARQSALARRRWSKAKCQ